jgi:hypothetical protein
MFSDPQSVTVDSVAQSMPRISSNGQQSVYVKADESFKMTISHSKPKGRIRSMVRLDQRAVVADPLTAVNDYETLSFYCVVDRPEVGFTSTQVNNLITGFKTWLDSTAVGKVFGQES